MQSKKIPNARRYKRAVGAFGKIDFFHSANLLPLDTSPLAYNFDLSSGALRAGYGTEYCDYVPQRAIRYWIYRFYSEEVGGYIEQYLFQTSNGLIQMYDPIKGRTIFLSGKQFPPVTAFTYRLNSVDTLFFSGKGQKLSSWNGITLATHEASPSISSMALHYERLFVTSEDEPTRVYFSDDLDPTNWDIGAGKAGFIELLDERGYLNKVVSFGSYLYIFRDHGISRITAFGDEREFAVVNLFVTAGRIFPTTIATCGSVIVFLASDGMYIFDGYECKRVLSVLDGLIAPDDECACEFFEGRYYLACKMNFGDGDKIGCENGEYTTNGLLVYDPRTGEYSLSRGLNINYMHTCTYAGKDFLMCNESGKGCIITRCGGVRGEKLKKHWQSPPTDFSMPQSIKYVHSVYGETDRAYLLTLISEKGKKVLPVSGGTTETRADFAGKRISFEIDTDEFDPDISPPSFVYSVYDRG